MKKLTVVLAILVIIAANAIAQDYWGLKSITRPFSGIHFVNPEGMPSLDNAILAAGPGDVIYLWPGVYNLGDSPKIPLSNPISLKGMGGNHYDTEITGVDSLFAFSSDSISFENLTLTCTGGAQIWYATGSYTYHEMINCCLDCSTCVFGPNSYWYVRGYTVFVPRKAPNGDFSAPEGWLFYGLGTTLDMKYGPRLGYPYTQPSQEYHGVWFAGGAKSTITGCEWKANQSPVVQLDSTSHFAFVGGRILTDTIAVICSDASTFNGIGSTIASDDAVDTTIIVQDSADINLDYCTVIGGTGSGNAIHHSSNVAADFFSCNFTGNLKLRAAGVGSDARKNFYGVNSIQGGSVTDNTSLLYGRPVKHISYGSASFDGTAQVDTVLDNAVLTTSVIMVTYTSSIGANDQGYIYAQQPGYFIWRRGSSGTSGASYRYLIVTP